ncbi:Rne/Rng family ribonuclease [Tianweitania sp. BSSL-BM11]|uniref:Ribonuclease E n=1 Tax=Tianweitania aestuarii TaxID=2814886 RepID=A0ABS5RU73_9HYPH|nr:ribonuclease E/G [Tianweitania aestuarii]MBS9720544.1 Rne/Rng family ribonuclease [Tianweitania aestuarii]
MPNKMLIDASHPEETRVVVTRGNRIEEFDFESQDKKQLRGNIYLARVTRVEPSLQAAFVEYGGNRHGFLAFSEIHPDYYQIPLADRQALLRADAEEAEAEEKEDEEERSGGRRRRSRNGKNRHRDDDRKASSNESEKDKDENQDPTVENGGSLAEIEMLESASFLSNSFSPAALAEAEKNAAADERHGDASDEQRADAQDNAERNSQDADRSNDVSVANDESQSAEDEDETNSSSGGSGPAMPSAIEGDVVSEDVTDASEGTSGKRHGRTSNGSSADDHSHDDDDSEGDDDVESVGAEDAIEEAQPRRRANRRQYKIQEVIKRRQILLVQVVKEERGNKGAALTTYLSLAGRYSVLMPNTARGGGISRKITNIQDRKRLKDVVKELEVPQGMGVILRTAGESRTKAEIRRDYEYLMRMWENVRTLTLQSTAPALVYEEGSLIKRSVRDLYNKDISEIQVAGEEGYREAKDFMRMLMPSHAKVVQPYRDTVQIFARNGIEAQLDRMLQPQVNLKSGGYIIINQTEALVAIDVNSGRSTKEHSIEDTALQTNLEAADEVARQLRLRDLAGLIVVDFIDMEENRNNRAVEKRMKDALKNDRARIQVGRISHFGLLEMSRQRIRASVLESTTQTCPHCGGTGHIRSESSVGLHVIRGIEEYLLKDNRSHITVRTPASTALYVLNHKRSTLVDMEKRFGVTIEVEADETLGSQHYAITRGAAVENPVIIAPPSYEPVVDELDDEPMQPFDEVEDEVVETEAESRDEGEAKEGERDNDRKRKRRRRRRGGRDRDAENAVTPASTGDHGLASNADEAPAADEDAAVGAEPVEPEADADGDNKKRRRGKRGGRRNRREDGDESVAAQDGGEAEKAAVSDVQQTDEAAVAAEAVAGIDSTAEVQSAEEAKPETAQNSPEDQALAVDLPTEQAAAEAMTGDAVAAPEEAPAPAKRPRARRSKKAIAAEEAAAAAAAEVVENAAEPAAENASTPTAEEAPEAQPAPSEQAAEPEASVQVEEPTEEPARRSRRRTTGTEEPVEPVVTSTGPSETADEAPAPRKGGWWQRKSFF